jgi:hypothetical protein
MTEKKSIHLTNGMLLPPRSVYRNLGKCWLVFKWFELELFLWHTSFVSIDKNMYTDIILSSFGKFSEVK